MGKEIKLTKKSYIEMSHNINNPLAVINGHLCKKTFTKKDQEEMKKAVVKIHDYLNSLEFFIEG